ncbi:MAG: acyl-CoA dehydrogenase, partial [Flavobacteriaceae bacterium]
MTFAAPVADIAHALNRVAGLSGDIAAGRLGDLSDDLVAAVLEEAGRFATNEIAPLNTTAEESGTPLKDGAVTMPPGWKAAYDSWVEGGWGALSGPPESGGQGLPHMLAMAVQEMWNSASMSFGIGTVLTAGAVEAIAAHGSDDLKARYLEKMVSGEWTGTMNLTEPQAGSDLALLRARAGPAGDGTYRIFGTKIFITYGEHDLTGNIVHLVLARLPDAPAGTRGISLFLVPKFLPDGTRNDAWCTGVEHKLGIHGSPTCTMTFGDNGGAVGWLVGEENRGLNCMFTMMNNARLAVGIQGVAIAERAFQQARAYANERRQGRLAGMDSSQTVAIAAHPDVRRNLATMQALTAAARAICYETAHATDIAHAGGDEAAARRAQEIANLLTPVAKAFSTDIGVEVASIGVQVHGGMGYVEETGAAQHLRDARIAPIYEGTNGIQAIDLVSRKLPQSGGQCVKDYITALASVADAAVAAGEGAAAAPLKQGLGDLLLATEWILKRGNHEPDAVLAGATPYLRLFGLVAGGALILRGALAAADDPDHAARLAVARFYLFNILPQAGGLAAIVTGGA